MLGQGTALHGFAHQLLALLPMVGKGGQRLRTTNSHVIVRLAGGKKPKQDPTLALQDRTAGIWRPLRATEHPEILLPPARAAVNRAGSGAGHRQDNGNW